MYQHYFYTVYKIDSNNHCEQNNSKIVLSTKTMDSGKTS